MADGTPRRAGLVSHIPGQPWSAAPARQQRHQHQQHQQDDSCINQSPTGQPDAQWRLWRCVDEGLLTSSPSQEPNPSSNRGPSLSMSHAVGATASGGMDALPRPTVMEGLDAPSNGQQFAAEAAYGFPALGDRLTLTPALALALSPDSRSYKPAVVGGALCPTGPGGTMGTLPGG